MPAAAVPSAAAIAVILSANVLSAALKEVTPVVTTTPAVPDAAVTAVPNLTIATVKSMMSVPET